MDEQFDNKLTNRIREVFDNYEYPPAEQGWAELRKKFPEEQSRNNVAWLWWSSAAAILLVFIGIALWLNTKPAEQQQIAVKTLPPATQQAKSLPVPQPVDTNLDQADATRAANRASTRSLLGNYDKPTATTRVLPDNTTLPTDASTLANTNTQPVLPDNTFTQPKQPSATTEKTSGNSAVIASQQPQVTAPLQSSVIANQPVTKPESAVALANARNESVAARKETKSLDDLLNEKPVRQKPAEQQQKKVSFGVYAATYVNYAEGSANQFNAGAGFTSDFKLGRKLKLSTGVMIAQNSLSYNSLNDVNRGGRVMDAAAAAPADVASVAYSASKTVAEFKNYNASLIGLDVPINIKYEFSSKSQTYISAGLSSGTFIDERYTSRYDYRVNGVSGSTVTTTDQTSNSNFSNFYFARTLNVSFGFGYSLGKSVLVVEPFVKYPLAGMGAQDIRFGAGGLNLKLNFNTGKK